MEYHEGLGLKERFNNICKEKRIKPYSLTSKGVKEGTIVSIKTGSMPAADALLTVAKALNVSIEELLSGETSASMVWEAQVDYGRSKEEQEYAEKLVKIMRTKMDGTVQAIKQNIDAFLTTPDKEAEGTKKTKTMVG